LVDHHSLEKGVFEGTVEQYSAAASDGSRLAELALIECLAFGFDEILEHGLAASGPSHVVRKLQGGARLLSREARAGLEVHGTPLNDGRKAQMEEIVSERHGYNFNGYLLRHSDGNICIDPVQPSGAVLDELLRMGAARIVITNRNHCRAANLVRDRLGARTAIHPEDAAYARGQGTDIDDNLRLGERTGPLEVIGVAGKSPGEVALLWRERRILIVGDAVIGNPPANAVCCPRR
jgi:hypothetical protein